MLAQLQKLLEIVGLESLEITSIDECVPMLWVAITEGLLSERIPGIARGTVTEQQKLDNLRVLLDFLSSQLQVDLSHIKPTKLLACDLKTVGFLIELLESVSKVLEQEPKNLLEQEQIKSVVFEEELSSIASPESFYREVDSVVSEKSVRKRKRNQANSLSILVDDVQEFIDKQDMSNASSLPEKQDKKVEDPIERLLKSNKQLKIQISKASKTTFAGSVLSNAFKQTNKLLSTQKKPKVEKKQSIPKPLVAECGLEEEFNAVTREIQDIPVENINESVKNKHWQDQITGWTRVLNDRLWRRKLAELKKLKQMEVDFLQGPLLRTKELLEKAAVKEDPVKMAKFQLRNRERIVTRMLKRQQDLELEIENLMRRREIQDDRVVAEVYKDYLEKQRREIIEKRREAKEIQKELDRIEKDENASLINYLTDQNQMLQEELKQKMTESALEQKQNRLESQKLLREFKEKMKTHIKKVTDQLNEQVYSQDSSETRRRLQMQLRQQSDRRYD